MISITQKLIKSIAISYLKTAFILLLSANSLFASLIIDESDPQFAELVNQEVSKMEGGDRGIVCKQLIENIRVSVATTTISALTADEKTWHQNDSKGTRSHVVPLDTLPRGSKRTIPTSTKIYVHQSRIDPQLSLFKLGTFAELLAEAMTLNMGIFSSDYRVREKQAMFFRNAWRDSMNLGQYATSGNVPTNDYKQAKKLGLITEQNRLFFPIINPEKFSVPLSTNSHVGP